MIQELARQLTHSGHEVTICCPKHNVEGQYDICDTDCIKILFFKSGELKVRSKIRRGLNESLLSWRAWRACQKIFHDNEQDVILYYSPTIFFGPLVSRLKKLWSCKSILILRDIFPQWLVDSKKLSRYSILKGYFELFESINYNAADVIAVQTKSNIEHFSNKSRHSSKLEVLHNWSDTTLPVVSPIDFRKKYCLEGKVVFLYGGNIGFAQDIESILILARDLTDIEKAFFLLVGSGDKVGFVKDFVKKNNMQNVLYLPPVSQSEYYAMLDQFDIGLFALHKNHSTHNFPGKVLGYLRFSVPTLGCANPDNDLAKILNNERAGLVSLSGDHEALFKNALLLINSPHMRNQIGKNGNDLLLTKFSTELAAEKILTRAVNI